MISRLETMVLMSGMDLPLRAIREQISSAVDVIVHLGRLRDGTRRITQISEITGMEGDVVAMQDLFVFDFAAGLDGFGRYQGTLRPTGLRPLFLDRLAERGIQVAPEVYGGTSVGFPR